MGVACNLEYENHENRYLEFILTSNFPATGISKKNDGNLEINLKNGNLEKAVQGYSLFPGICLWF